jgi:Flp pilus assembly protein TadD
LPTSLMHPRPASSLAGTVITNLSSSFLAALALLFGLACSQARADDLADVNRLYRSGQTAEAFSNLDRLQTAKPKDPAIRFLKGVLLADAQRNAEAVSTFQRLIEDYPELPEPHNNLAVLYAAAGDDDKARASLEAALRANPTYTVAQQNLGDVYARLATRAYERVLQLEPANTWAAARLSLLRDVALLAPGKPTTKSTP